MEEELRGKEEEEKKKEREKEKVVDVDGLFCWGSYLTCLRLLNEELVKVKRRKSRRAVPNEQMG